MRGRRAGQWDGKNRRRGRRGVFVHMLSGDVNSYGSRDEARRIEIRRLQCTLESIYTL